MAILRERVQAREWPWTRFAPTAAGSCVTDVGWPSTFARGVTEGIDIARRAVARRPVGAASERRVGGTSRRLRVAVDMPDDRRDIGPGSGLRAKK